MFIVVGLNKNHSIFESSKTQSSTSDEVVYPPAECFKKYTFPALTSSISFYFDHSVFIEKNGQISVLGNNKEGQLGPYFHKPMYDTLTYSNFSQNTKFISSVVGSSYTLFMYTYEQNKNETFAYISWAASAGDENDKTHNLSIDLEVNGKPTMPAAIFGGSEKAAIIDVEGNVFTITKEPNRKIISPIVAIPDTIIKVTRLVFVNSTSFFSEKAISVACCNNFTVVLTKSGKLYGNGKINQENGRHINESEKNKNINDRNSLIEIEELKGHNIVQISGTFQHVLAVSSEGRVFGVGSNYNGQLGIGANKKNIWRFEEIDNIYPKYRIINTSSGSGHSIFISETGEVLTCGNNGYHQLFEDDQEEYNNQEESIKKGIHFYAKEINIPKEMKGRATFSIAGNCLSGLFINTEPPPNQPNTVLKSNRPYIMPYEMIADAYEKQKHAVKLMQEKVDSYKMFKNETNSIEERSEGTQNQLKGLIECNYEEIIELRKKVEMKKMILRSLQEKNKELSQKVQMIKKNVELENEIVESCSDENNNDNGENIHFIDSKLIESSFEKFELVDENCFSQSFVFCKKKLFKAVFLKKCQDENQYNEQLKCFFNEYMKLSSLDHPNIVKTVGFIKGDSKKGAGIVQEYFPEEMSKENIENKNFSNQEIEIIFKEIIGAIKYLNEHQIFNINIKPRNISIENNKHIKIHLQPQIQNENQNQGQDVNDNNYKEYEIFFKQENQEEPKQNDQEMIEKEQVYSIGIFIIYLFNETQKQKQKQQKQQLEEESKSPKEIQTILKQLEIPRKLNELLNQMISTNSEKRPTLSKIESELEFES